VDIQCFNAETKKYLTVYKTNFEYHQENVMPLQPFVVLLRL